jgi:hypothetical protein
MQTDHLIALLARHAGPASRVTAWRVLGRPLILATGLALAGGLALLGAVPAGTFVTLAPWIKLAYTGTLALALGAAAFRAGLPGQQWQAPLKLAGGAGLALAVLALAAWLAAPAPLRADTVLGSGGSWTTCAAKVALLALPALGAGLLALRRLAPTGLTTAGALVGGAAGACGAFAYAFTCPESSPAYVAVWYTAGITVCAGLGALAGPRLLRW